MSHAGHMEPEDTTLLTLPEASLARETQTV